MRSPLRARFAVLVALLVVAGCSTSAAPPSGATGNAAISVVASTTVFADMVRNVGGEFVTVSSLVPPNGDVHTFSPRPSDIRSLAEAHLVVMNGLGLDDWLTRTVTSASSDALVVQLAVDLPGADYIGGEAASGPANPHLWLDVTYGQAYAKRIAAALAQVDPAHAAAYAAQGDAYVARLADLDTYVTNQIGALPAANRRIVAFHDAFPYFAKRYGLDVVGVAVPAPGQDPSAGYTATLIEAIRQANVRAIFSEAQFPPKLVTQLAQETGASVVATLYDDSIGDPPISSYEAVIKWDTDQFVKALS